MSYTKLRGHPIYQDLKDLQWKYVDTNEPTAETWQSRPCGACGQPFTPEGHDPCLGTLRGVMNACCGHGEPERAYVQTKDGTVIDGEEAILLLWPRIRCKDQGMELQSQVVKTQSGVDCEVRTLTGDWSRYSVDLGTRRERSERLRQPANTPLILDLTNLGLIDEWGENTITEVVRESQCKTIVANPAKYDLLKTHFELNRLDDVVCFEDLDSAKASLQ